MTNNDFKIHSLENFLIFVHFLRKIYDVVFWTMKVKMKYSLGCVKEAMAFVKRTVHN